MLVPLRNADFHVPKTASGDTGAPPHCQSWHPVEFAGSDAEQRAGSLVMSVMNSAGKNGRPEGSVAVRSPTCGSRTNEATFPEAGVKGETGELDVLTPSSRACSSL